jgi:hypothetical protein
MCSSLVDWPIYPRLANTMRALNDAQNTGRMRYATSLPRHAPGNIRLPRIRHRRPSNIPPAMLRLSRPTSWPPPNSWEKQTNHHAGEARHAPNFGLCREVPPAPSMCLGRIGGNGRRRRVGIEGYAPSATCDDKCAKIPLSSIRIGARRDKGWHATRLLRPSIRAIMRMTRFAPPRQAARRAPPAFVRPLRPAA